MMPNDKPITDSRGRCIYHPQIRLLKPKLFLRFGSTVLRERCPLCMLILDDDTKRLPSSEDVTAPDADCGKSSASSSAADSSTDFSSSSSTCAVITKRVRFEAIEESHTNSTGLDLYNQEDQILLYKGTEHGAQGQSRKVYRRDGDCDSIRSEDSSIPQVRSSTTNSRQVGSLQMLPFPLVSCNDTATFNVQIARRDNSLDSFPLCKPRAL